MTELAAHVLPETVLPGDWQFFRDLAAQAVNGSAVYSLLAALRIRLNVSAIVLCYPGDPPPDAKRLVVAPLQYHGRYLGDLCAVLSGGNSELVAARLAFFEPVISLALVAEPHR